MFGLFQIFLFGLLMSYAYLRTGQLWLAIGLHAGWDYSLAVLFWGTPVSGLRIFHMMDVQAVGHPFGFYILSIVGLLVLTAAVYFYTRHRKPEFTG